MAARKTDAIEGTKFIVRVDANPDYCGIDAGSVQFAHGEAVITDARMAAWFKEHDGYSVEVVE